MMIGGKEETLVSVLLKLAFQCALSDRSCWVLSTMFYGWSFLMFFSCFFIFVWLSKLSLTFCGFLQLLTFMDIYTASSSDHPHRMTLSLKQSVSERAALWDLLVFYRVASACMRPLLRSIIGSPQEMLDPNTPHREEGGHFFLRIWSMLKKTCSRLAF